jgi:putative FmdB family regulatory protein
MPIYEYRCKRGHNFEVMRSISDEPLAECVTCSAPVERVFHPIAVHFKGSGFYNTDYGTRKRSREKEAEKSSKDGASSESGGSKSGSSDSKSESSGSKSESGSSKSESGSSKSESGGSKSESGSSKSESKAPKAG